MGSFPKGTLMTVAATIANIAHVHSSSYMNTSCLDPEWSASSYLVEDLPNVTFQLPLNWAGQIPVPSNTSDELFFWLFEAEGQTKSEEFISEHNHLS